MSTARNIEGKLRQWQMAWACGRQQQSEELASAIFRIVFHGSASDSLWGERILAGLTSLFQVQPPAPDVYGTEVESISRRVERVRLINDALFKLLDPQTAPEEAMRQLNACAGLPQHVVERVRSEVDFAELRNSPSAPSVKLQALVDRIAKELQDYPGDALVDFRRCIEAMGQREGMGAVNALLVHQPSNKGMVLSLSVAVENGPGQVRVLTPAAATFQVASERARQALVARGFIAESQDLLLTLDLTEAEYSGGSVALGVAVAAYGAAGKRHIDPFSAFTGDINLKGGQWLVQSVEGVPQKLQAALAGGCRRVFLPRDNEADVPEALPSRLKLVFVNDIAEVLQHLSLPATAVQNGSGQARKISLLRAECLKRGWQLSQPKDIQGGLQFTLAAPHSAAMKVNIYDTGAHLPISSDRGEFHEILLILNGLDSPAVGVRPVQQTFNLQDAELRAEIRAALLKLCPVDAKQEQYCEYVLRFEEGRERLTVKQFTSGKLQVQGSAGPLYKRILDVVLPRYNLGYPNAALKVEDYLGLPNEPAGRRGDSVNAAAEVIPFPHIGTDESGKGDYFGPLVIAAVWLDELSRSKLEAMGVRDSKLLSDQRCRELAAKIRDLYPGKYEEVEILPERYNALYEQFRREGKNLNTLLAWGHARALESLLGRWPSQNAVADQFGDEKYIRSKLMEKGKTVALVQTPKAERYTAVAAASILARDRFLNRLDQMSATWTQRLPKGASHAVVEAARAIVARSGPEALSKVAKLHFKTTSEVLAKGE